MENLTLNDISLDKKLTKSEIKEIKDLVNDREKLKSLFETNKDFGRFINSEYRWANENLLIKNKRSVRDLQKKLGFKGADVDGLFGKDTFFSLIKFQKENGLVVDGLAGKNTQKKLFGSKIKKQKQKEKVRDLNVKRLAGNGVTEKFYELPRKKGKINKNRNLSVIDGIALNNTQKKSFGEGLNRNEYNEHYLEKGKDLADYVERIGYKGKPGYCGANVGNMLLKYGIEGLPKSGRHGYRWDEILEDNPNFKKVYISNPSEAKPGGILVYDQGYGRSRARQNYGHVEIALNSGKYYYGTIKRHPGGSINANINNNSGFTGAVYYPV